MLVDLGADDNFIDSDFVFQYNIPTLLLHFYALDGRLLSQITHCTAPHSLHLSGNHHEHNSLFLTPSPNNPHVLGLTAAQSPYRLVHFHYSHLETFFVIPTVYVLPFPISPLPHRAT